MVLPEINDHHWRCAFPPWKLRIVGSKAMRWRARMRLAILILALQVMSPRATSVLPGDTPDRLVPREIRLPEIGVLGKGSDNVSLSNQFAAKVSNVSVHSSCGCTRVVEFAKEIAPGAEGVLSLAYDGATSKGERKVELVVEYLCDGQKHTEVCHVIITSVQPEVRCLTSVFDFGRCAPVVLDPIIVRVVNSSTFDLKLDQYAAPEGFTVDFGEMKVRDVLPSLQSWELRLRAAKTILPGAYASALKLSFHYVNRPSVTAVAVEEISGEVAEPAFQWADDGDPHLLRLGGAAPSLFIGASYTSVESIDVSAPLQVESVEYAGQNRTRVVFGFRDHIEDGQRIVGRIRVLLKDPACPMVEWDFDRFLEGGAELQAFNPHADHLGIALEKHETSPRLLAAYDRSGSKISSHFEGPTNETLVVANPTYEAGIFVWLKWNCGAIEERFVPTRISR